jgi:molybdopterin/thiamine biosynthesis adenylyltransferase
MPTADSVPATLDTSRVDFLPEEMLRYGRHFQLPGIGTQGQARLKSARVLLIGVGGLGSPAALYLAAAGVGTLGVVDPDRVDLSNLQRQVLHGTPDVGRPKSESAEERIHNINPNVAVERFDVRLTSHNALDVMESFDIVIDGSDNFPTRYLVNDAGYHRDPITGHGITDAFRDAELLARALDVALREPALERRAWTRTPRRGTTLWSRPSRSPRP